MKQMRPLVTPAARENLTVGRKGDRPDLTAAIFSNVREHITVVYASPPLDLRLSPGDRGKIATFRKLEKLPVAFEGVEAFSGRRRPQLDLVIWVSAAADELRAIWRPYQAQDCATAHNRLLQ
jgi:hypothetical protein